MLHGTKFPIGVSKRGARSALSQKVCCDRPTECPRRLYRHLSPRPPDSVTRRWWAASGPRHQAQLDPRQIALGVSLRVRLGAAAALADLRWPRGAKSQSSIDWSHTHSRSEEWVPAWAQEDGVLGFAACTDSAGHWIREVVVDAHVRRKRTLDRKSTRLNSSHANISYAVF